MTEFRKYIDEKLQCRKKILSIYLTAGYPDLTATVPLLETIVDAGADLIELGIPFSDPLADGPTIQESSQQALAAGTTLTRAYEMLREFKKKKDLPVLLMGYANPFMQFGWQQVIEQAKSAGATGFIIPDLPPEESQDLRQQVSSAGLDLIFLVSPNTPSERIKFINEQTTGFIYAVSVIGVTGERDQLPPETTQFLTRLRQQTTHPVLVGFGVSNPQIARNLCQLSDGVIIGSAVIRRIAANPDLSTAREAVFEFVHQIKTALDSLN